MLSTENLQVGDILLIHTTSWSDILSMFRFGSWWTHASMYYGMDKTVEMTNKNVKHLTFSKRYGNNKIRVIRLKGLTVQDRVKLRKTARKYYHLKFDRLRLMLPLMPQFRKDRYWCSTFVDLLYKKALGRTINVKYIMQNRKAYLATIRAGVIYDYRKGIQHGTIRQ